MHGLPGPLVKWFLKTVGGDGIYRLAEAFGSTRAKARTLIGYANEHGSIQFFEGVISGRLVPPRGTDGFGWDAIFQPDNSSRTFAEMTPEDKNQCSMRRRAVEGLRRHLEQRDKGGTTE